MVDYNILLKQANQNFPIGTKYTGLIHKCLEKAAYKARLSYSTHCKCKGVEVGIDWVWLETKGWCKEFKNQSQIYELW